MVDRLLGESLTRNLKPVSTSSVLSSFKEFLLLFFGAAWDPKSTKLAAALREFLKQQNTEGSKLVELLYVSNDDSEEEMLQFMDKYLQGVSIVHIPWRDDRIMELREHYKIDCVPVLVVLDTNLDIVQ